MGRKNPLMLILFMLLVSAVSCLKYDDQNLEAKPLMLAKIEHEKQVERVKAAETIINAMENIFHVLSQNDMKNTCKIILQSSGYIGNVISFGVDLYFPEKDPVIEKLDEITEKLVGKLAEISHQIDKATQEIKAFIEDKTFEEKVTFLVNQLMSHISMFYTGRSSSLMHKLNRTCQHFTVESVFVNMKTMLDSNAIATQLKYDEYSEAAFKRIESVYKNMTKQLLVAFPICEILVYGKIENEKQVVKRNEHIVKFVFEIEEKLKEKNEERQRLLHEIEEWNFEIQNLKPTVESFKKQSGNGWEQETLYGISSCGEHFAILVTTVVRSAVRVFAQKGSTLCAIYGDDENDNCWKEKHYWTPSSALQHASEWKNFLENGQIYAVRND